MEGRGSGTPPPSTLVALLKSNPAQDPDSFPGGRQTASQAQKPAGKQREEEAIRRPLSPPDFKVRRGEGDGTGPPPGLKKNRRKVKWKNL